MNEAIRLKPDYVVAYSNRGNAYNSKGEVNLAIQDYDTAIQLKPDYAEAYSNRGNAYKNKNQLDAAIKDLNKAIELNPELAEAYNNRGNAYTQNGKYDLAIENYDKAIKLNPTFAQVVSVIAVTTYGETGNFTKAIDDLYRSDKTKPRVMLLFVLISAIPTKRSVEKLIKPSQPILRQFDLEFERPGAYYSRGNSYLSKGDYEACY